MSNFCHARLFSFTFLNQIRPLQSFEDAPSFPAGCRHPAFPWHHPLSSPLSSPQDMLKFFLMCFRVGENPQEWTCKQLIVSDFTIYVTPCSEAPVDFVSFKEDWRLCRKLISKLKTFSIVRYEKAPEGMGSNSISMVMLQATIYFKINTFV